MKKTNCGACDFERRWKDWKYAEDSRAVKTAIEDLQNCIRIHGDRLNTMSDRTLKLESKVGGLEFKTIKRWEEPKKKKRDPDDVAMSIFFWTVIVVGVPGIIGLSIYLILHVFFGV